MKMFTRSISIGVSAAAITAALVVGTAPSPTATASTISGQAPVWQRIDGIGPRVNGGSSYVGTQSVNPASYGNYYGGIRYSKEIDAGGYEEEIVYVTNSMNSVKLYQGVVNSYPTQTAYPGNNVHQYLYQYFDCFGLSCQYLYEQSGPWLNGLDFSVNGSIIRSKTTTPQRTLHYPKGFKGPKHTL